MLKRPADFAETLLMDLRGNCAEDAETGATLSRSRGRRKAGRPTRYWYWRKEWTRAKVITAFSDDEAIEEINARYLAIATPAPDAHSERDTDKPSA